MLDAMRGVVGAVAICAACGLVQGDQVTLEAAKDNTLYFSLSGNLSNGSGDYFFSGRTLQNQARRGVLQFDVSSIPAGSTIDSVTLRLFMSKTIVGARTVSMHRVTSAWGEGGSDATGEEGAGTTPQSGDATWIHRSFPSQFWTNTGGDFIGAALASTSVGFEDFYEWTGAGLVADVQGMVDGDFANNGWLLLNEAGSTGPTAKRFNSREHPQIDTRPVLTITFTPAVVECPGDLDGDLDVDSDDLSQLLGAFGSSDEGDVDGDGDTDSDDLGILLGVFGTAC
ncbi:MAG: DNRLRE domain-containing protein [Phycisphaerales bacterium]